MEDFSKEVTFKLRPVRMRAHHVKVSSQDVAGRGIRQCKGLRQEWQVEGQRRGQWDGRMPARRLLSEFKEISKSKIILNRSQQTVGHGPNPSHCLVLFLNKVSRVLLEHSRAHLSMAHYCSFKYQLWLFSHNVRVGELGQRLYVPQSQKYVPPVYLYI